MTRCSYCGSFGKLQFNIYSRTYYRCSQCDLIYQERHGTYEEVLAPYLQGYYDRYGADQIDGRRDRLYDHILNIIERKKPIGTILDVGTGLGFFIDRARKKGWMVKGIEPSLNSRDAAEEGKNLDIFRGTLQEYHTVDKFDIITFINVLDHSAAPWQEIQLAGQLLKPDGMLFIRIPNGFLHQSLFRAASVCGFEKRIQRYLIFHQYSLTPRFIERLLKEKGFAGISISNSKPSSGDPHGLFGSAVAAQSIKSLSYYFAKMTAYLSAHQLFIGTSLDVIAFKNDHTAS